MTKILYTISEYIRHPAIGGPYLRIENSIKALNRVSELHLVIRSERKKIGGERTENFFKKHCNNLIYTPLACIDKKSLNYKIRRLFLGKKKANTAMTDTDFIIDYARKNGIDIIWFGYGNISYDLMRDVKVKAPELKLVCDTDSVWSRFILRSLPFAKNDDEKLRIEREGAGKEREEQEWVNFCNVTTAVSEIDADYYRELTDNKSRISLFSNVIDISNYAEKVEAPADFKMPNIYLAGSFGKDSPMDVAARWILSEVLPIVRQEIPDVHLYIVGNNSRETLNDIQEKNVTIVGKLDSVLPYLCNANVALVPLKFESGTRFKILEAAACAVPIVSTTLGAEGIPVENGENILIADEPEEFAKAIVKLIKCPALASLIASNLKRYVCENYSIEKHSKEALQIINFLDR